MPPPATPPALTATQDGFGAAAVLFVAMLLFYLISMNPFVDLTGAAALDPAADKTNLLNQLVFLALTAGIWIFGARAPLRETIARPRLLLAILLLWFLLVSALSPYPTVALKRVVLAFLTCVNAGIFLLLPRSEEQFVKLLAFSFLAMLAVAYFGVTFLPRLAIHQAAELREPINAGLWRGQFPHKNAAAATMVLASFVGLYVYGRGLRVAGAAIIVLAVVFLAHTGGKTATAALPGILIVAWAFERWRALRVPIAIGGVAAFNILAVGSSVADPIRQIVLALGVDPTFTNRSDIWRLALSAIADRPVTGYGFQMFWQTDALVYSRGAGASWAVEAYNGHNAYLDLALTTGVPGLLLAVTWLLILPLRDIAGAKDSGNDPALTRLFIRIWLYGVFTSCVESILFQSGSPMWFAMVFSVFGLRLQARAAVIDRPPSAPAATAAAYA